MEPGQEGLESRSQVLAVNSDGFVYDDGGRAAAGFKGATRDCVTRSIAIATGKPYREVYDAINDASQSERRGKRKRGKSSARTGVHKPTYKKYLASLGWIWHPTMQIGSGCKVHLCAEELPSGRLIVAVSRHLTTMIDGVIHDTFDPRERGCTIYPPNTPADRVPKGARWLENGNGWAYEPQRCVYGYFTDAKAS